jgi:uncharacterized protein YjbI with pentapeptide repeats
MQKRSARRAARAISAILAAGVLSGAAMLSAWVRAYWVAMHHGQSADLRNAFLIFAPLKSVDLEKANLAHADLIRAELAETNLAPRTWRAPT